MCGIAGAFGGLSSMEPSRIADKIIRAINYRGPDGHGLELLPGGFFVHLRLSIIDTSQGGSQPKWSEDGRFCITYNGEIYNYRELKSELQRLGHHFVTQSDTEVLLKVWEVWGQEGLRRCIGMYAFALFDAELKKVHFARDPYGIKPIYVAAVPEGVRFASTYPGLAEFPDCPRRANPVQAFRFLRYGTLEWEGHTLVEGVRAIRPGTVETWDVSNEKVRLIGSSKLVDFKYASQANSSSFAQAAEELRDTFLQSVRLHMRSDVPIGFALSGGIDSSAIVCAARILEPSADLRTFTYSAQGGAVDELPWANLIVEHTHALPHIVRVGAFDAMETLDTVLRTHGTPTGSMSPQAQYAVFEAAHNSGIKVMLDGQGGDETFAGYPQYFGSALAGYLRRGEITSLLRCLQAVHSVPGLKMWQLFAWMADHLFSPETKRILRKLVDLEHAPGWVNRASLDHVVLGGVDALMPSVEKFGRDILGDRLAHDLTDLQIPSLLHYEDRNSMCHSVESRVPFLSLPITKLAFAVNSSFHIGPQGVSKHLLRAALKGILPERIRNRPDKVGFEVPQSDWLVAEREVVEKVLSSDTARAISVIDHKQMMEHWSAIDRPGHPDFKYVWRWLGLIKWTQIFDIQWV